MRVLFMFILLMVALISCNYENNRKTTAPTQQMTGEWSSLSIKVDIQSKNNTDSNQLFEVDRVNWEEVLKIKPIRTFFRADSTWNSAHYDLNDSLVYNPSGKWWIENEKLVMQQMLPSLDTTVYALLIIKNTASFECLLDWDMDGKKDDKYYGTQVKIKSDRR